MGTSRLGLPAWLFAPAALGAAFVALPLVAMLTQVEWSHFGVLVTSDSSRAALELSLRTSLASTVLCLVLGVPMALVLSRTSFPGQAFVRSLVLLPLVLPPVVGGIALLYTFGRRGLLGHTLDVLGWQVAFSTTAVVMAQTFVSMPFLIVAVEGALRGLDDRLDDAAATLGASRWFTFRHVTLPMITPAVAAGAVLCFARALGEFGATITFAGNLPGRTQTMPLAVYLAQQGNPDAALALALVLLVVAVVILAALRDRWLRA